MARTIPFEAEDVVVVPPYTRHTFVAGPEGFRAWVPETRFWHVLGLLWHEHFEAHDLLGIERLVGEDGSWNGYRVPEGVLGLDRDLEIPAGAEPKREAVFRARRAEREASRFRGEAWYDDFLRRLPEDNERYDATHAWSAAPSSRGRTRAAVG